MFNGHISRRELYTRIIQQLTAISRSDPLNCLRHNADIEHLASNYKLSHLTTETTIGKGLRLNSSSTCLRLYLFRFIRFGIIEETSSGDGSRSHLLSYPSSGRSGRQHTCKSCYTFRGSLGESRMLPGRSGPPGADYNQIPALKGQVKEMLFGYWREGLTAYPPLLAAADKVAWVGGDVDLTPFLALFEADWAGGDR